MHSKKIKLYDNESLVTSIGSTLLQVENCFSETILQRMNDIINGQHNEFFVPGCRYRLQLKSESPDQKILNEIGRSMVDVLSNLSNIDLKFLESKYWIDLPLFASDKHADSEFLAVNFQIYIGSALYERSIDPVIPTDIRDWISSPWSHTMARGAKFYHVDPPYEIPFKPNTGYININNDQKIHDVSFSADCRQSVMFQYVRV
jgi:hypothetical protein